MIALSSREGFHDDEGEVQPVVVTCLALFNIHMTHLLMLKPNMSQQLKSASQYIPPFGLGAVSKKTIPMI